jgi:hypothetical protein
MPVSFPAEVVSFFSSDEEEPLQLHRHTMQKAAKTTNNFEKRLVLIGVAIKLIFMKDKVNR